MGAWHAAVLWPAAALEQLWLGNCCGTSGFDGWCTCLPADILDGCKVGDKVTVDVLRHGDQRKTLTVKLGERIPEIAE